MPPCPHSATAMRVTCPNCSAGYEVPESRIGAGRRLRCARCKHDWWVEPPEPATAPAAPESSFSRAVSQAAALPAADTTGTPPPRREPIEPRALPPPAVDAGADAPPATPSQRPDPPSVAASPSVPRPIVPPRADSPPGRSGALLAAWVGSLMIFVAVLAALLLYRVEIMEAWAPAERLYDALGIGPQR